MAAFPASRRTIQRTPRRRLLFLLLLLLLAEHSRSRPCPARAVFMHSPAHGRGMCVCAPGDDCIGEACARGPPVPDAVDHGPQKPFETHGRAAFYSPSYTAADVGFPASCIGCSCVPKGAPAFAAEKPKAIVRPSDGSSAYAVYADPLFDSVCRVNTSRLPSLIPAPEPLRNISWLHVPKCGTSFTSVIYHYVCANGTNAVVFSNQAAAADTDYLDRTCTVCHKTCQSPLGCVGFSGWAPHDGLILGKRSHFVAKQCTTPLYGIVNTHVYLMRKLLEVNVQYVGTFRNPLMRLRSAYNHARHAFGMPDRQKMVEKTRQWSLKQWVAYPGVRHCQTKMLIGRHCGAQYEVNRADVEMAKLRLRENFAFVGLVEAWNASICLFHRQFGNAMHSTEIANLRPGETDKYADRFRLASREDLLELTTEDDPYDYEIYQLARQLFIERMQRYGLIVPEHILYPPDIYS